MSYFLPHLRGLPHLAGVPHLHVNRPKVCSSPLSSKVHTSMATLTEGCTSSITLLERGLLASTAELFRESFKSVSMVPVAIAMGDAAAVADSR